MNTPFTPNGYLTMIQTALDAGYTILPLCEGVDYSTNPILLLRHDVDFSLDYAIEMAEFEKKIGVRSTYYILLYNNYYNPFSPIGREQIQKIQSLGHEIGLHWDSSLYPIDESLLTVNFLEDINRLSSLTKQPVLSASQHIPTDNVRLKIDHLIKYEAYSTKVWQRFIYVSDSSMQWRSSTPQELISQRVNFQFLAHPIWWFATGQSREEKLRTISTKSLNTTSKLCEEFIIYMNQCLNKRQKLDAHFQQQIKEAL